ncbi:MAG TPA: glycosyltransferase family 4 protein, partial [Flavisolibacter sp.]|nr:glycosyltransferase family 4 protein [Flavisolibacter sp.]
MANTNINIKVLMTADTVGGVWTYCMDLCKALRAFDAEVHLVTMGEKMREWQRQDVSDLDNVIVYETTFQLEWMENPWKDIEACGEYLLQLEEDIQPDIIHLNCFAFGSWAFKAPVLMVAHSDVWSWFLAVKNETPGQEWNRYFDCVQAGLHEADKVVAPSKTMLRFVESIYGVRNGRVIYNGRDAQLFSPGEKKPIVFGMGR